MKAMSAHFRAIDDLGHDGGFLMPECVPSSVMDTFVQWSELLISMDPADRVQAFMIDFESEFMDEVYSHVKAADYLEVDKRFTRDLFALCLNNCTMSTVDKMLKLC